MDDRKKSIIELTKTCEKDKTSLPRLAGLYIQFGLPRQAGKIWLEYAQVCADKENEEGFLSALEEFIKSGIQSLDLRFYFAKIFSMKDKKDKAREELNWLASEFREKGNENKAREVETYLRKL